MALGQFSGDKATTRSFKETSSNKFSAINKIIIVLQENHTFDNYFGTFPRGDGILGKSICIPESLKATNCISPFHNTNLTPVDMNHNWSSAHIDYDGGKMDAFVYSEGSKETLGYYNEVDIPHYWKAAQNYVLCDSYFTSVMSESAPNHLYMVAGTAGGLVDDNVPSTLNFTPVFEKLDGLGVSWKVYGFSRWYEKFAYVQSTPSAKKKFSSGSEFANDVESGNLSDVSWIIGAPGGSEHPPQNIQIGENSVANDIVNKVGTSTYWKSAVIFVTWDDYGGFYDHVPPPQVDNFGYGFRVPCLVISPFSKMGYIDSAINDHTSILKFIEQRYALSPLSSRDATANDMSEAFDFSQQARSFQPI